MGIKINQIDKHFITEYYIRKGFIVVWVGDRLKLTKRGSNISCDKIWVGGLVKVRDFIESIDKYLREIS